MSNLPKSMELDIAEIARLEVKEKTKGWLRRLLNKIEEIYKLTRDHAEAGGMGLAHWRFTEDSDGNLILKENRDGVWTETGWKIPRS